MTAPNWILLRRGKRFLTSIMTYAPGVFIDTVPRTNGGNHLYQFMTADRLRHCLLSVHLNRAPEQDLWLEEFPLLERLTATKPGRWERRTYIQGARYGTDFYSTDLRRFCQRYLLSSPSFQERVREQELLTQPGMVTVNVRRGDYYGTHFEPEFGMRVVEYLRAALGLAVQSGPITALRYVSDDLAWCEKNCQVFADELGVPATYVKPGPTAFDDLAALATSERLIVANSTFSYWGAYLAHARGLPEDHVIAPRFHQRELLGRTDRFVLPGWRIVESLPGGWQSQPTEPPAAEPPLSEPRPHPGETQSHLSETQSSPSERDEHV